MVLPKRVLGKRTLFNAAAETRRQGVLYGDSHISNQALRISFLTIVEQMRIKHQTA